MAVTVVTTTMAGAINYTHVTDTSADWPSVPNSTYFYDKADKLVHYKNSSGVVLEIFGTSGLTYFTEAQNTAAPNATVPVDSLTAVAGTTNADIALVPKGTGAFTLAVADNTATGGNKRGANAIDLSTKRTNAADVASGISSIAIGESARATNTNSFAVGLGGIGAVSSNQASVAIGSWTTATGANSFATGSRVDAVGLNSVAIGGYQYGATTA
jgi:hypothetical protein